jgi:hypothetical protein
LGCCVSGESSAERWFLGISQVFQVFQVFLLFLVLVHHDGSEAGRGGCGCQGVDAQGWPGLHECVLCGEFLLWLPGFGLGEFSGFGHALVSDLNLIAWFEQLAIRVENSAWMTRLQVA